MLSRSSQILRSFSRRAPLFLSSAQRSFATSNFNTDATIAKFFDASNANDVEKLSELIKKGFDVNKGDYDNRRAIHLAAAEGAAAALQFLIKNNADVNAEDRLGATPLDYALLSKQDAVIPILRKAGARCGKSRTAELVSMMCTAAAEGNVQVLQRCCEAGVDMNLSDYDLRTPLHVACSEGHFATVEFLLKQGARANAVDRFGNTPLGEASRSRSKHRKAVMQLLQETGAVMENVEWDIRRDNLLQSSLFRSLPFLAQRTGSAYVECWIPNEDESEFNTSDQMNYASSANAARLAAFLQSSPEVGYTNSQNPFGKAWASQEPQFVDITEKSHPSRFQGAKACGLKTAMIMPVVHAGKTFALLQFFLDDQPANIPQLSDPEQLKRFQQFCYGIIAAGVNRKDRVLHWQEVAEYPKGQMNEVFELVLGEETFSANLIYHEVDWFYHLGLHRYYFNRFPAKEIAKHCHSFIAAKKLAVTTGRPEEIMVNIETKNKDGNMSVLCMCPIEHTKQVEAEKLLQSHISKVPKGKPYTTDFFSSKGTVVPGGSMPLGIYVMETSEWSDPKSVGNTNETDIEKVSSQLFERTKSSEIKKRYQTIMSQTVNKLSPLAEAFPLHRDGTLPLMFAFLQSSTTSTPFNLQLTELLKHNGLTAHRKFVETFSNNIIVLSVYLTQPYTQQQVDNLLKQFSMLHICAQSALTPRFLSGEITAEQYTYLTAASRFVYYFLNKRSEEFDVLARNLKNDPLNLGRLRLLQTRLKREAVSQDRIAASLLEHPQIAKELFEDFARAATLKRDPSTPLALNPGILAKIKSEASSQLDEQVLTAFLSFNSNLLKTNFYKKSKGALAFRLDPRFLADSDWPQIPYGLFFVLGSDFQGFHVRFMDIARGGIRMIRSNDRQAYTHNLETLFAENYGLAYTQNKKNKDIPEFGSKGTVLLNLGQTNSFLPFKKYTSALLDLLTPSDEVVDNYGREEILFLGPDEGTAEYMEWAARYAKTRDYKFWRAFTTGKPPSLGGVPHDTYGMTTRGVHRYVVNCLAKLGLDETQVTKFQTGGPDGDLGSNEILLSKDKTLALVDGSGVVYDPQGLNREEISRLAHARSMIKNFDVSKLSKGGFRVLVSDTNVVLPSGELVASGLAFRNEFHLHPLSSADMFVPCGGRPESVNLNNVNKLFDSNGKPRFKIVVEGANLFLTQDARMVLEQAGVVLYKDASANKGGVTSSSLEVLAALALQEEEFEKHMAVHDEKNPPKFYGEYVKEIQERIEHDADLEFECIWKEHEKSKTPRYILTDQVSDKINQLNVFIQHSSLWENEKLRATVLRNAIPKKLQELVGLQQVLKRVPESYIRAIFGAHLASRYVYKHGLDSNEFNFFEFIQPYLVESMKNH